MLVDYNVLNDQQELINRIFHRECELDDEEWALIDGLNNLLDAIREERPFEESSESVNRKPKGEPHDLECSNCGLTLNNQCLDPDCTETEDHASEDLLCSDCQDEEDD